MFTQISHGVSNMFRYNNRYIFVACFILGIIMGCFSVYIGFANNMQGEFYSIDTGKIDISYTLYVFISWFFTVFVVSFVIGFVIYNSYLAIKKHFIKK